MTTEAPTQDAPVDQDAIKERGQGLELSTKRGLHTGKPAFTEFDPKMRDLIRDSLLPADASDADLYYLLEVAATYRLDPFAKELWAIRLPGKNASARGTLTIMVGRDGLLAIAERHPDFRGFRNGEVYEADEFAYDAEPRGLPDGSFSHVRHSFDVTKDRGNLLGAWAEVYREDRPPVFFWAPLGEYDKSGAEGPSPWKKQRTAMIRKVALVNALRLAYRISGLYIADEMSGAPLAQDAAAAPAEEEVNWGNDPAVKNRLIDLFAALGTYTAAKVRVLLASCDDDGRMHLIDQLEAECEEAGIELPPPRGEGEEVVAADEVEVVDDADVVAEEPPPPAAEPARQKAQPKAEQGKLVE